MRRIQFLLSVGLVVLLMGRAQAQAVEICNDAKDNDGDGLIDCADSFCVYAANIEKGCRCFDGVDNDGDGKIDSGDTDCASFYGLTFVGSGSSCSINPPPGSGFTNISPPQTTQQNTADTPAKVVVGDINGDGTPDAAVCSKWNSTVQVIATANAGGFSAGDIMADFRTPGSHIFPSAGSGYVFEYEVMIADINKDKKAEIFAIASHRGGSPNNAPDEYFLTAFKYTAGSLVPLYNAVDLGPDRPGNPGIADFDGDGKAEIYIRNRIYAAESGVLLANPGGNWDTQLNAGPVAANITGDSKLELICGNLIYSVPSLSSRALTTLTLVADMNALAGPDFYPKGFNDLTEYGKDQASSTSTADFDGDGFLDVLMTGAINCSGLEASPCGNNITTIFYWNFKNGTISTFAPPDTTTPSANGWIWGTGRINLGDPDGDGKLEALFVSGNQLYCLELNAGGNLVQKWVRQINDSKSGILSVTVYDFDNDGQPEVVYRDSQEVAIIDGLTGAVKKWSAACQSHTWTEGPVIADVNGDGGTDICVTCNTNNSFNINAGIQQQSLGQTRLYYSSANAWLPTRKVWNQHPYYVTNINDDLTLPYPQLDPSMIFSNAPCPNGLPGPQRPLNLFMNQVPRLSKDGCPEFPAPDLSFSGDDPANPGVDVDGDGVYTPAVVVIPPICGDLAISAFFNIVNNGDLPISDNVPVSFFNGDPRVAGAAVKLFNTTLTVTNLQIGQKLVTPTVMFNGPGTVFNLYIVLYNNGAVLPINLTPGQSTKECKIENNIYSVQVTPDPFTATAEKVSDNFKCSPAAPNNGQVRSRIFKGGVEVTDYSPYTFQWYTGVGTGSPIPGATNYNLVNSAEGTYTVVVTNPAKGCSSTPVNATIVLLGNNPTITVVVNSDQTKCNPPNGQLEAFITGGNTGYTFDWYDVALTPLGISGPIANGLVAGSYVVLVSKDGCTKASPATTVNGPQIPDAQAVVLQNVVDCANTSSGSIKADAYFNGVLQNPANYSFDWYFYNNATSTQGSILPPANGTGQTRTGLAVGYYQAVIKETATQCTSSVLPIVQVLNSTVLPTAQINEIAPQTSCDPANPNGILSADALIGGVVQNPASFTFEWFKGDNTLPANLHANVSGVNGQQANKVSGGGVFYTVRVKTTNNCSATNKYIITENINVPVVTLVAGNNSICDPALAGAYNGSVTATVTFAGVPVAVFTNYQFTWHNGSLVTDPVIAVANNQLPSLSQLNGGFYTVEVKRTDLGCNSVPVTIQVLNAPVLPTIVNTPTPSTNCSGTANGAIAALVDLGGGVTTTAGYSFKWFQGNNTAGPLIVSTPNVSAIAGGQNYTVQVINSATGCTSTQTVSLANASALPVLTLTPQPNGICNAALTSPPVTFGGSVAASATYQGAPVGSFAGYTFQWHNGPLVTDPVNGASTNQNLSNLNGGFYTVTATITALGCTSVPVSAEVLNNPLIPVITTNSVPSTNCDPALKNGKALVTDVSGLGIGAPFIFKWYDGVVVAPGSEKSLTAAYNNVQGGAAQNYTVQVTNQNNGCQNTSTVQVADNSVLPLLFVAASPNGVCDPLLTNPPKNYGGSVTANVTNQVGPITDYAFTWHDGALSTDPVDASSVTSLLSNKPGGPYTVTTKHNPTGCISSPGSATVIDSPIIPSITTNTVPSTNCDPLLKNGQALVTDVNGAGTGAPFTFKWYDGNVVVPGSEKSLTATYNNVQGGAALNYTVLVTDQGFGCQNTVTLQVADNSELPLITVAGTDNTSCLVAKNGTAALSTLTYQGAPVLTPFAGYSFSWDTGPTTSSLSSLPAGSYTLTVTKTNVGCTSSPAIMVVNDNPFTPPINIASTPQTSCNLGSPNGILAATIDETAIGGGAVVTGGYSIIWHSGNSAADPVVTTTTGTNGEVNQLDGNLNYFVEVTRTITGCKNTSNLFLPETIVFPAVTFTTNVPLTRCDTPNGSITATVTQVPAQTYTYFWMKEAPSTTTTNAAVVIAAVNASTAYPNRKNTGAVSGNVDTFGALIPGDYTIVVVDNFTTCVSQPTTSTIVDNSLKSNITITLGPTFPSTCGVADGQMTATVAGGVGPYDMFWHRTGPTNTNINFFDNPPQFTPPDDVPFAQTLNAAATGVNNVSSGIFTLVVTDKGNGCGNFESIFLPFINSHTITPTLTPSTVCPPTSGNGNIKVTVGNIPGGRTFQDFTYTLYSGSNAILANKVGVTLGPGAGVTSPENFPTPLPPGFYTIEVRQNFSGLCPAFDVVEIIQDAQDPVLNIVGSLQANTSCDVLQADGSAVIDIQKAIDDNTVGSTYTLNVSPAPLTGVYPIAGLGTGNRNVGGLQPISVVPQYTITVTSSNNCVTQRIVTIPDQPALAELVGGNITITDADRCSPSGSVEVTSIDIIGAGPDNLNNFAFDWFSDITLSTNVFSAQGNNTAVKGGEFLDNTTFAGIGPGSFWVVATKNAVGQPGFGCTSVPFKADIADASIKPIVALTAITNTACDTNYEGQIQLQASDSGGPGIGGPYTYTWDIANPIAIPTTITNNGNGVNDGDGDNPTGLKEGTYTVFVSNNSTSCQTTGQVTLLQADTPIVVANATPVNQAICGPDGSITVGPNDVTVNGAPDPVHANFIFDWFVGSPVGAPIVTGAAVDVLNVGNDPLIGAGDYYVTALRAPGVPFGSGCKSAPLKVTIDDLSIKPTVNLAAITNTACDTNYEGQIQLTASDAGGLGLGSAYTYTWDPANPVVIATTINNNGNGINDGDGDNPLSLKEGTYTVTVTNNVTACPTISQVTLLKSATPIVVANATSVDQAFCSPDGSITVGPNDVTVNGAPDPVHANFIFDWFAGSPVGVPIVSGSANDFIDVTNVPTIGAGDFYVTALRAPGVPFGSGCKSAPLKVTLNDVSVNPTVAFSTTANTSCDNNFDASISLLASTTGPGSASNYDLTWTSIPAAATVANAVNVGGAYSTTALDVIAPGTYTVLVTNLITQCTVTGSAGVVSNPQVLDILTVNKTDQAICYPDGSITVSSLSSGVIGNYSYNWFLADPQTPPLVDGGSATITTPAISSANFPTMGFGTYYVVGTRNPGVAPGSGCKTPPFRVDVLDLHLDPTIAFTFQPNSSCDNLNPNAAVLANAAETSGANGDTYSFAWQLNGGALPGVTTQTDTNNSSQLASAYEGTYQLAITNVTTTGCSFTSSLPVDLNLNISLPNIISVNSIDPTDCLASGSAQVASVSIGGGPPVSGPALTTNFTYEWYANTFTPPDLLPTTTPNIVGLSPISYFVLVQDNATKCKSGPREVQILDTNIVYPVVNITQTAKQISCVAATGTAGLAATGDGQTDANLNYGFAWFPSLDITGAQFASTSAINNLLIGNYSVNVTNSITGCSAFALYIVPDDGPAFTPEIVADGVPRTLCVGVDGAIVSRVVNIPPTYPFAANYTSDLFKGTTPNLGGAADFPNMATQPGFPNSYRQPTLLEGFYTIRITDNNTGCFQTAVQEVQDKRQKPVVVIVEDNPMINCDPAIANGQLSATADGGQVSGFTFAWHSGATAVGPVITTNDKLIGQRAGQYTVKVVRTATGCLSDTNGSITDATIIPPVPTAVLVSDRTNCVTPNGWVTANVAGVTFNYSFDWYNGSTTSSGIKFTGVDYLNRDIGTYGVTATDQVTGCVSPIATVDVGDGRIIPEFTFESTPSYCSDVGKPKGAGSITLILTNAGIILDNVIWSDVSTNGSVGSGVEVYDLFPGFYRAQAVTSEGCTNEGIAEVGTEINPYNGVSVNGDSQNEAFIIDCITNFPNNNVKIFNRSGVMVYEQDGYNNQEFSFKGLGEQGIYFQGAQLPVGTYFYIIDKRNGSKPLSGYLELNR